MKINRDELPKLYDLDEDGEFDDYEDDTLESPAPPTFVTWTYEIANFQ